VTSFWASPTKARNSGCLSLGSQSKAIFGN
jgi:hypothetical protein